MLVRRLKERCAALDLVQIGTSATMISRPDATALERRQSVADFATRFFGHRFSPEQVVEETLAPFTEGGPPRVEELRGALEAPLPDDLASLRRHPLMRWIEYELGVEREPDGSLKRRVPSPPYGGGSTAIRGHGARAGALREGSPGTPRPWKQFRERGWNEGRGLQAPSVRGPGADSLLNTRKQRQAGVLPRWTGSGGRRKIVFPGQVLPPVRPGLLPCS